MNKILRTLRNQISGKLNKERNKNYEEFCKGFIVKYFLGDGTIVFPSKNNVQIFLTEADSESRKDFQSMLHLFNIDSFQRDIRVYASTNVNSLLWFLENNLFVGHENNRKKLLDYILRNYFVKTAYDRLVKVGNNNIEEYARLFGLSYNTASMSLHRYRKRGFLESKKDKDKTIFYLTEKGKKFVETIKHAETESLSFHISKRN
jgi:predicted transcriptional regulator